MRKKRVILLSQWFEPEPTFKGLVFAKGLVEKGFEVEVVTGFPNYPGGKLYPGYRLACIQRETIDGIQVTRLPLFPSHDRSAWRRIATYVSFAASATLYCLLVARKADVVYVYQLLTLGVVAALIKAIRGTPFVLDIQDIWPDTLRVTGFIEDGIALRLVDVAASWTYRRADKIVVLSPGFRELLLQRGGTERQVAVIYNWCDEASLRKPDEVLTAVLPSRDKFCLLFAGNMGAAQALTSVLDAAAILQLRSPKIAFVMIGGGVDAELLRTDAVRRGLENVTFLPRVSMERIGSYLRRADALLIHLKDDPLFRITIPGKTQAYMAIGKPILMAAAGDAAALVREASCAVEAVPQDAGSIAEAAEKLASLSEETRSAMGSRGRAYYETNLSLSVGLEKVVDVLASLG